MDLLTLHQRIYERTDGRLGHRLIGVPCLLLRTTGRRTGETRVSALVYARDGEDYVLVASNGGSDKPPGWLFNVEASPAVEVQAGRKHMRASARVVTSGDPSYPRLWKLVNDGNHGRYDVYQLKTRRPIPLVVVTPGKLPSRHQAVLIIAAPMSPRHDRRLTCGTHAPADPAQEDL